MCTHHVAGELSAKVVAAFAPSRADDLNDHLFELVWSGAQVIGGPPPGCVHVCIRTGVCAACSQELHSANSFCVVKWTIQLRKITEKCHKTVFAFRGFLCPI